MKRLFRWLLIAVFAAAAFFAVLPPKGYIPVLMYHFIVPKDRVGPTSLDVSVDSFNQQMWFLKTFGFRTISLDEYYAMKTGQAKPRGREVLITFDDGNETYLQYALPVLERYKIKSANFLVWNFLEQKQNGSMSVDDARRLSQNPLVTLGAHTLSHPSLLAVSPEQARIEVTQSKEKLEKVFGRKFDYFAYPSGSCDDETIQFVREAGYRLAFRTSRKHLNQCPDTPYSLLRIKVSPKQNLFVFWLYVSGIIDGVRQVGAFFH